MHSPLISLIPVIFYSFFIKDFFHYSSRVMAKTRVKDRKGVCMKASECNNGAVRRPVVPAKTLTFTTERLRGLET